jgi:hypothetical protein
MFSETHLGLQVLSHPSSDEYCKTLQHHNFLKIRLSADEKLHKDRLTIMAKLDCIFFVAKLPRIKTQTAVRVLNFLLIKDMLVFLNEQVTPAKISYHGVPIQQIPIL